MATEELVLKPDFDITKAQAKINKLNRDFEISKLKAANIAAEMQKTADNIENSKQKLAQLNAEFEQSSSRLDAHHENRARLSDEEYQAEIKKNAEIQKQIENEIAYQEAQKSGYARQEIELSKQNAKTANIAENIALAKHEQNGFGKAIKKSNNPLTTFFNRIKGLAKRVFIFSVITKALRAMRTALSGYIAQDSKLSSSIAKLKGNLATIGATLSSALSPILTVIVDKCIQITNLVGAVMARLLGKDVKQMQKLANSTKNTAENAEKATASFDTLQKIDTSTETTSNNTSGINTNTNTGMQTVDISAYPMLNSMLTSLSSIDMTPLNESLERLNTALEPYKEFIYEGLQWLWNEILVPLAAWTIEDLLPHFIDLLSAALNALAPILDAMKPSLEWVWEHILKPFAKWLGDKIIELLQWLTDKLNDFAKWAKENPDDVQIIADVILSFLAGLLFYLATKKVIELVKKLKDTFVKFGGLKGLMSKLGSAINSPALAVAALAAAVIFWIKNWKKIKNAFNGMESWQKAVVIILGVALAIAVLVTALTAGVAAAAILAGLGTLGLGVGILAIGNANEKNKKKSDTKAAKSKSAAKSAVNDTLSTMSVGDYDLPALATGAVLPGGSPMLAWVNDQPKGQGYIEGSVENIAAAFEKYLGNHNLGDNQKIVIEAKADVGALMRFFTFKLKEQQNLSGVMT